jgi:hypothetical protein
MNYIIVPFKYKNKTGDIVELIFVIPKHQPNDNNVFGVNLKALVEDFGEPAE